MNLYYDIGSREAMKVELFLAFSKQTVTLVDSSAIEGKYHGVKHILETPHGDLFDPLAICKFMAREARSNQEVVHLYGQNNYEESLIDQWLHHNSSQLNVVLEQLYSVILAAKTVQKSRYHILNHQVKHVLEIIDAKLKLNSFICGNFLSLVDICLIADLFLGYRLLFTEKYRKTIPYLTKWYENFSEKEEFQSVYGLDWVCQRELIPEYFLPEESTPAVSLQSLNILPVYQMVASIVSAEQIKSSKETATKRNNLAYHYFRRLLRSSDKDKKEKMAILWQTFQLLDCSFWKVTYHKISEQDTVETLQTKIDRAIQKFDSYWSTTEDYGFLAISSVGGQLQVSGVYCFNGTALPEWIKDNEQASEFNISAMDPIKSQKDKNLLETVWSSIDNSQQDQDKKDRFIYIKLSK